MSYILPISWGVGFTISTVASSIAIPESGSEHYMYATEVLIFLYLLDFSISCKLMFHYKRPM